MSDLLIGREAAIRLGFFLAVLAAMAAWEVILPRRKWTAPKGVRWYSNLGIVAVNSALVRLVYPLPPVAFALLIEGQGWGFLGLVEAPRWLAVIISVLLLDLAIWIQHVIFHAVPVLWRLHRMHHADLDFDVTTGVRFHPIEILLSILIKMAAIAALGAPAEAVVIFEVLLNATSLFNHGNVRMPGRLDRVLRWLVVTPDMHRVHHSDKPHETNSNFGFNFPWWDRLFGTYRAQPEGGHEGMTIGLDRFREPGELHLLRLLTQPFRGPVGRYPINRRYGGDD